ncbi:uncharacterized protein LOC119767183 [Culex quinquefasciatus]|uniref:uncharacterized protein LOC119767183 n=1 Tax=Culex quinquefasciatus TaxID=7176 RepID=UPI0018E3468F|nr:uncharacterized protein LOC119767183 [Culex quinquefasciatus]
MLPQLTVYAEILCLLMVVMIAGATPEYMYLQSACSSKFVRIAAKNGTVFADDNGQSGRPQTFTTEALLLPKKNFTLGVAIRCQETDMYLCFDKNWKIKGMKVKGNIVNRSRCHFYETLTTLGYFRFQSVISQTKYLGFIGSGKQINYKMRRHIDEKCYNFQRMNASFEFGHNNLTTTTQASGTTHAHRHKHGQRRKGSPNNANGRQSRPVTWPAATWVPSPAPPQRTTQMSNEVHTSTSTPKPTKMASTKKQIKTPKRLGPGKANKKGFNANVNAANIRHHRYPAF